MVGWRSCRRKTGSGEIGPARRESRAKLIGSTGECVNSQAHGDAKGLLYRSEIIVLEADVNQVDRSLWFYMPVKTLVLASSASFIRRRGPRSL